MNLAAWARANGVHPQTADRWLRQGTMPVPARRLLADPRATMIVVEHRDRLVRPTGWSPWRPQPGVARGDLREPVARSRRRRRRPGRLMGARQRFQIPQGWIARGFRLEVAATTPEQPPAVVPLGWGFYDLRRAWNQAKQEAAPWWLACSKEAYTRPIL